MGSERSQQRESQSKQSKGSIFNKKRESHVSDGGASGGVQSRERASSGAGKLLN